MGLITMISCDNCKCGIGSVDLYTNSSILITLIQCGKCGSSSGIVREDFDPDGLAVDINFQPLREEIEEEEEIHYKIPRPNEAA